MANIFISYRRSGSAGHTGRLFDALKHRFGEQSVFRDIENLEPGIDFVKALDHALEKCDVLLVVISKDWTSETGSKGRRIDQTDDFVRMEVAKALAREVRVIPVLVAGATMPTAADLPEDLHDLTRRNAIEISDSRWEYDVGRLGDTLAKVLDLSEQAEPTVVPQPAAPTAAVSNPAKATKNSGGVFKKLLWAVIIAVVLGVLALEFVPDTTTDPDIAVEVVPDDYATEQDVENDYATCPVDLVANCSEHNLCTACDSSCGYCQNLDEANCGPQDCMTCPEGSTLVQVYGDGTGYCDPDRTVTF